MTSVGLKIPLRGVQLVQASAGSGKTYTIATLFVRALLERDVSVDQLLVLTFTKAATAELQERLRDRVVQARDAWQANTAPGDGDLADLWNQRTAQRKSDLRKLRLAVTEFDRSSIFTIHGYCQRILQSHAFDSGAPLSLELLTSDKVLLQDAINDFWARHFYDTPRWMWSASMPAREHLLKLAHTAHSHRDAHLFPAPTRSSDGTIATTAPDNTPLVNAKLRFADAWSVHRDEVLETLATTKALRHNKYQEDRVRDSWPIKFAKYVASEAIEPPDELLRMTDNVMRQNLAAKAAGPPNLPIAREVEDLVAASDELLAEFDSWLLRLRWKLIEEVEASVTLRKAQQQQLTFDDLLHRLRDALRGPGGDALAKRLRDAYPIALIDEFQDTDPVQSAVFQTIYAKSSGEHALLMIGDPKQAIYGFRGADIFAYLDAARCASDMPHALAHNWRSDPGMIAAVNAVFTLRDQPFVVDEIEFANAIAAPGSASRLRGERADCTPLTFLMLPTDESKKSLGATEARELAAQQVAHHIGHLLHSGLQLHGKGESGFRPLHPRDIAVLCRTNKQGASVQERLRALGIPTARDGESSVFEADIAISLQRVMQAVLEPGHSASLRVALVTPILGLSAKRVVDLDDPQDPKPWEDWVARAHAWHDLWSRRGFMAMFQQLMREQHVSRRLLSLPGGQRMLTDLTHLAELLQRHHQEHHAGPHALVQWLARMRVDEDARDTSDDTQMRMETDDHAVRITTLHRSKGLEYPIVYCPFLWDVYAGKADPGLLFHKEPTADALHLDIAAPHEASHVELAARESLAEEVRLAYVALTRARHRCIVTWGPITNQNKEIPNALSYLLRDGGRSADEGVRALIAACPDHIDMRPAEIPAPPQHTTTTTASEDLAARKRNRPNLPGLRLSSYSRLIHREGPLSVDATEGLDRDEDAVVVSRRREQQVVASPTIRLATVKSSASAGLFVHEALEHNDFRPEYRELLHAHMQKVARLHGIHSDDAVTWSAALNDCLDTRFGTGGLDVALSDLAPEQRLPEMEFMFPVGPSLTARRLADRIAAHDSAFGGKAYAARLRAMTFASFSGFLRGYIDLCFEHAGRYYVLDFKTNHLGDFVSDYGPDAMHESMVSKDYYLQALIYSVALHRHLQARLVDYNYSAQFGGYVYLFLRGMAPSHPRGTGVVIDRPDAALLSDLADLLAARPP